MLLSHPARAARVVSFGAALLGAAAGCVREAPSAPPRSGTLPAARPALTAHVVIVSLDGLRPDAIDDEAAPTLTRLMRQGSYSLTARTILPSLTLPSHTSMLTGVSPAVHGVTWNSDETETLGTVTVPTAFGIAREHGLRTAAFFSKPKFRHLMVPGTLDYAQAPAEGEASWPAARTVDDLGRYLAVERPNLLFVHLGEPDYAGHQFGWMSFSYLQAVGEADRAVARIVAAADAAFGAGAYALIVTADHGGHGTTHGTDDERDLTIPWIAWGDGVLAARELGPGINTTDTAASALWILGVAVPAEWSGAPVGNAFLP